MTPKIKVSSAVSSIAVLLLAFLSYIHREKCLSPADFPYIYVDKGINSLT